MKKIARPVTRLSRSYLTRACGIIVSLIRSVGINATFRFPYTHFVGIYGFPLLPLSFSSFFLIFIMGPPFLLKLQQLQLLCSCSETCAPIYVVPSCVESLSQIPTWILTCRKESIKHTSAFTDLKKKYMFELHANCLLAHILLCTFRPLRHRVNYTVPEIVFGLWSFIFHGVLSPVEM